MAGGSLAPGEAGASPNHRKRKAPVPAGGEAGSEKQELGREVEGLADLDRRILEHLRGTSTPPRRRWGCPPRRAPPARPEFPIVSETSVAEEDQELLEKLKILKTKIEANIADFPKVLEKMNGSVAHCEKLENLSVNIPSCFSKKMLVEFDP